jgi:hypothetical protein
VLTGLVADQVNAVLAAAEGGMAEGRTEAVAGAGAGQEEVADPDRYKGGGM